MTLTVPLALLGLLTLPIIIALHMLRARSTQYIVSSLSLWNFLDQQMTGARARRIPFTLLLFIDLLIASLLSLALAQPELSLTRTVPNARHILVILDVSSSMSAIDADIAPLSVGLSSTRFAQAQSDISDLLRTLTSIDIATLITFGASVQTVGDTRTSSLQSLTGLLQSLVPGEQGMNLESALALANASRDSDLPAEIHIFTDAAFPEPSIGNSRFPIIWHLYGSSSNNQAVLSLTPSPLSTQKIQLFARFANFSDQPVTRRSTLIADGNPVTTIEITLDPYSTLPYTWDIIGNPSRLTVQLEGSDDLPADDTASLGLNAPSILRVALVSEISIDENPDQSFEAIARALAAIPSVTVQLISPDNYLAGSPFDLVIFKDTFPVEKPTSNILILGFSSDVYIPLDPSRIILQPHPFFIGLDFTGLRNVQLFTFSSLPGWLADYDLQTLLEVDGEPILLHGPTGLTQTTLFLPDLASGNLTRHPTFILFLNNIVNYYRNLAVPGQIVLSHPLHIPTGTGAEVRTPEGESTLLNPTCPCDYADTYTPGLYQLNLVDSNGTSQAYWIGVNAGSVPESNITPKQFSVTGNQVSVVPSTLEEPVQLAPYLLTLVIVLLFLEAYLSWK